MRRCLSGPGASPFKEPLGRPRALLLLSACLILTSVTVDPRRLQHTVSALAAEPRPGGSEAHARARALIRAELEGAGWVVNDDRFAIPGADGVNLLAVHAQAPLDRPRLLVGAHYDSQEETPGADDNASAVAVLLELARLITPSPADAVQLQLIAYDLEEWGMRGSAHHARLLRLARTPVHGMISLEMLGCCDPRPGSQCLPDALRGHYPDTGDFIAVVGNDASASFTRAVARSMATCPGLKVEMLLLPGDGSAVGGARLSDHSPFWDEGFPALMITDTSFYRNPHYHQPTDTPETLDYGFLARVGEGVLAAVRTLMQGQ